MKWFSGIQQRIAATVMVLLLFLTIAVTGSVVRLIQKNIFQAASVDIIRDSQSFKSLHDHRTSELFTRAKLLAAEPRVIAALGTPDIDRETVQFLADEIRADGDLDLLMVKGRSGWEPAISVKGIPPANNIKWNDRELPGSAGGFFQIAGMDIHAVSTTVNIQGNVYGQIVLGDFVKETRLRALQPLIASEIILCAHDGPHRTRILAASLPNLGAPDAAALMDRAFESGEKPARISLPSTGEEFLLRSVAIDSAVTGIFLKTLDPEKAAIASALTRAMIIAAGFLILAALIVNLLSKAITRPILKLVEGTESIAAGNLSTRTGIQTPDELRRLSQSFNLMAEQIEALVEMEEQAKAKLEERVKERTAKLSEVNRLLVDAHHQLKEQTSRMIQYEKLAGIGTMAAGIAHEINNPLTVILGNAQFLEDTVVEPTIKKRAQAILKHGQRCGEIIQSLLRFSGREGPKRTPVNINRLIDTAIDMTKLESGFEKIAVVKEYDETLPVVALDASMMEQVFLNIVSNAFHAMWDAAGGGTLVVSTFFATGKIQLRFTDDGPGMSPTVKARIFDPFFTTKGVGKGRGLGLSGALGIVELHGGQIYVERTDSSGTTIAVDLPLVKADSPSPKEDKGPAREPEAGQPQGLRILIVDDESDTRDIMSTFLKSRGCEVVQAENGIDAFKFIEAGTKFDVLFVDIRMPGMDGVELHRQVIGINPDLASRFVFVTGDTQSPDIRLFLEKTNCEAVIKPFKMQNLLTIANNVVQKHRLIPDCKSLA